MPIVFAIVVLVAIDEIAFTQQRQQRAVHRAASLSPRQERRGPPVTMAEPSIHSSIAVVVFGDVIVPMNRVCCAPFQNADASYDFSSNDPYPFPRYTDDWFNR